MEIENQRSSIYSPESPQHPCKHTSYENDIDRQLVPDPDPKSIPHKYLQNCFVICRTPLSVGDEK